MTDWFILPASVAARKARSMMAPIWNSSSASDIIRTSSKEQCEEDAD